MLPGRRADANLHRDVGEDEEAGALLPESGRPKWVACGLTRGVVLVLAVTVPLAAAVMFLEQGPAVKGSPVQATQGYEALSVHFPRTTTLHHSEGATAVVADFSLGVALGGSKEGLVILWNLRTGRKVRSFFGHKAAVRCLWADFEVGWAISVDSAGHILTWNLSRPEPTTNRPGGPWLERGVCRVAADSHGLRALLVSSASVGGGGGTGGEWGTSTTISLFDLQRGAKVWSKEGTHTKGYYQDSGSVEGKQGWVIPNPSAFTAFNCNFSENRALFILEDDSSAAAVEVDLHTGNATKEFSRSVAAVQGHRVVVVEGSRVDGFAVFPRSLSGLIRSCSMASEQCTYPGLDLPITTTSIVPVSVDATLGLAVVEEANASGTHPIKLVDLRDTRSTGYGRVLASLGAHSVMAVDLSSGQAIMRSTTPGASQPLQLWDWMSSVCGDGRRPKRSLTGRCLRVDYSTLEEFRYKCCQGFQLDGFQFDCLSHWNVSWEPTGAPVSLQAHMTKTETLSAKAKVILSSSHMQTHRMSSSWSSAQERSSSPSSSSVSRFPQSSVEGPDNHGRRLAGWRRSTGAVPEPPEYMSNAAEKGADASSEGLGSMTGSFVGSLSCGAAADLAAPETLGASLAVVAALEPLCAAAGGMLGQKLEDLFAGGGEANEIKKQSSSRTKTESNSTKESISVTQGAEKSAASVFEGHHSLEEASGSTCKQTLGPYSEQTDLMAFQVKVRLVYSHSGTDLTFDVVSHKSYYFSYDYDHHGRAYAVHPALLQLPFPEARRDGCFLPADTRRVAEMLAAEDCE